MVNLSQKIGFFLKIVALRDCLLWSWVLSAATLCWHPSVFFAQGIRDGSPTTVQTLSVSELARRLNVEGRDLQFGDVTIPKGVEHKGPLVVVDGLVFVSGRVDGDLTVVNGSVSLQREAVITGDLTIIGGVCYASQQAKVLGESRIVTGRYRVLGSGSGLLRLQEDRPPPFTAYIGLGKWHFNRVRGHEGVLTMGIKPLAAWYPELTGAVYVPSVVTTHGYLDFKASIEQPLSKGRGLFVKAAAYKITDTPDGWGVESTRNSLVAFLAREDYYNYHLKRGFTVSVSSKIANSIRLEMSYQQESYFNLPGVSPFTLFRRATSFRINPTVDEGRIHSLGWRFSLDTRRPQERAVNAWFVDAQFERSEKAFGSDFRFTRFDMTLRRYNGWHGHHLDLRAKLAGSGAPLPLQRIYTLGAINGLRGFGNFEATGDRFLVANLEYRPPIVVFRKQSLTPWTLEGLVFFDTGTSFFSRASGRNSLLNPAVRDRVKRLVNLALPSAYSDLRSDIGVGFTVYSRLVDLTVSVAQNLHTTKEKPQVNVFIGRDVF